MWWRGPGGMFGMVSLYGRAWVWQHGILLICGVWWHELAVQIGGFGMGRQHGFGARVDVAALSWRRDLGWIGALGIGLAIRGTCSGGFV